MAHGWTAPCRGRARRAAPAEVVRRLLASPRPWRSRPCLRPVLGARARAALSTLRALWSPTHARALHMVRAPAALRARRAIGLLDSGTHRRRDRPRTQVRRLARRRRTHGRAHGPHPMAR